MNFRPTPLKTIITVVLGLFTNFIMSRSVLVQCRYADAYCHRSFLDFGFDSVPMLSSLIVMILVYCIWSLLQQHKAKS